MSENILCYDKVMDSYFRTNMEKLQEHLNKINSIMREDGYITYNHYIDVMIADLPEDIKERFKENRARWGDYRGYAREVSGLEYELTKFLSKTEDGTDIIVLQVDEIKKEL